MTCTWRVRAALFGCVACLVGCDHATKLAAEATLRDRAPLSIVPGVVDLTFTENRDIAFNAFSRLSLHVPAWVLTVFAVMATLALAAAWARRKRAAWSVHAGFTLLCAGTLGNGLDRLTRGSVVDFVHVHLWPVFNVADVLIVAGIVLLVLARGPRANPARAPAAPAGPAR